jgi:hypothetical protein
MVLQLLPAFLSTMVATSLAAPFLDTVDLSLPAPIQSSNDFVTHSGKIIDFSQFGHSDREHGTANVIEAKKEISRYTFRQLQYEAMQAKSNVKSVEDIKQSAVVKRELKLCVIDSKTGAEVKHDPSLHVSFPDPEHISTMKAALLHKYSTMKPGSPKLQNYYKQVNLDNMHDASRYLLHKKGVISDHNGYIYTHHHSPEEAFKMFHEGKASRIYPITDTIMKVDRFKDGQTIEKAERITGLNNWPL